jgi:hypothetical protein
VLSDTIQPVASFSGICDPAVMEHGMALADMPRPDTPLDAQMADMSR